MGDTRHANAVSQKFIPERRESKSRFFAHNPQTEKRLGPRSLRMTVSFVLRIQTQEKLEQIRLQPKGEQLHGDRGASNDD
jgi:hypothetical protein